MDTLEHILTKYDEPPGQRVIHLPIGRIGLARLFAELGFATGVEVGVERGFYSEALCQAVPGLQLTCVDAWKVYADYKDHAHQEKLDRYCQQARARLKPYGCKVVRKWSLEAVKGFANGSLDFVYLDANHNFRFIVDDLAEWSKKVRPGGIVAGHDYIRYSNGVDCHVRQAVDAWCYTFGIRPQFVVTEEPDEDRTHTPSWFYVK